MKAYSSFSSFPFLHDVLTLALPPQAVETPLPAHIVSRAFSSRQFLPPNFQLLAGKAPPTSTLLGGKQIADAAEAVMGAAIETAHDGEGLKVAFELALQAARALSTSFPLPILSSLRPSSCLADVQVGEAKQWSDFARLYGRPGEEGAPPEELRKVEDIVGYRFKFGGLLREALTHPSKIDQVSFQRFEFMGDSVRSPFFPSPSMSTSFDFFFLRRSSTTMSSAGRGRNGESCRRATSPSSSVCPPCSPTLSSTADSPPS